MAVRIWITPAPFVGYAIAVADKEVYVISDYQVEHEVVKSALEKNDLASVHPVKIFKVPLNEIAAIKDVETASRLYVITAGGRKQAVELTTRGQVDGVRNTLLKGIGKPVDIAEERMNRAQMALGPVLVLAFAAEIFLPLMIAAANFDEVELTGRRQWLRLVLYGMAKVLGPFGVAAVGLLIFAAATWWLIHRLRHPHVVKLYRVG